MNVVTISRGRTIPLGAPRLNVVAVSAGMLDVLALARRVAASEVTTVLLQGETGTGKEVIAALLHEESPRASCRFVPVNCAAIPEELLESELFGHEPGAFTDARSRKQGLLEQADHGTLFLDEISQMSPRLQSKLLRVLETQCFRRVGGTVDIETDIRFVAATNEDLRTAVRKSSFRMDLFYRLNVIQITIPPLRDRRDDILPLAEAFLDLYNRKFHGNIIGMTADASSALLRYDWPGNVRELRNAIERAMVLEESSQVRITSLPPEISGFERFHRGVDSEVGLSLTRNERCLIIEALTRFSGNQTRAAAALDVSRDQLRYRMKKHGLQSY